MKRLVISFFLVVLTAAAVSPLKGSTTSVHSRRRRPERTDLPNGPSRVTGDPASAWTSFRSSRKAPSKQLFLPKLQSSSAHQSPPKSSVPASSPSSLSFQSLPVTRKAIVEEALKLRSGTSVFESTTPKLLQRIRDGVTMSEFDVTVKRGGHRELTRQQLIDRIFKEIDKVSADKQDTRHLIGGIFKEIDKIRADRQDRTRDEDTSASSRANDLSRYSDDADDDDDDSEEETHSHNASGEDDKGVHIDARRHRGRGRRRRLNSQSNDDDDIQHISHVTSPRSSVSSDHKSTGDGSASSQEQLRNVMSQLTLQELKKTFNTLDRMRKRQQLPAAGRVTMSMGDLCCSYG